MVEEKDSESKYLDDIRTQHIIDKLLYDGTLSSKLVEFEDYLNSPKIKEVLRIKLRKKSSSVSTCVVEYLYKLVRKHLTVYNDYYDVFCSYEAVPGTSEYYVYIKFIIKNKKRPAATPSLYTMSVLIDIKTSYEE